MSNPTNTNNRTYLRWMWGIFAFFWLCFLGLLGLIGAGVFGELPTFEELENPKNALATEIYASDGALLGKYYIQNRSYTRFEELSPFLIQALIATEDIRFRSHAGIDFQGTVAIGFYTLFGKKRGSSTITQQLAKNLYPRTHRPNIFKLGIYKLREWITAVKIEKRYTKDEIIALYFNTVEFGNNAYGIKSAARTYFNKSTKDLTLPEAALLVGILKGTTVYSPVRNPEKALARRNTVIDQMVKYQVIPEAEAEKFKSQPLKLDLHPQTHDAGLATYFREYLRQYMLEWCENNPKPDGSKYNIYKDGLRIYTTLDSRLQEHAEAAMVQHMTALQASFDQHWKGRAPWGKDESLLIRGMKQTDRYMDMKEQGLSEAEIKEVFKQPVAMRLFDWKTPGYFRDTVLSPMDSLRYAKRLLHTGFMAMDAKNGNVKAWVGGINIDHSQYDHVNITAKRQVGSTFKPIVYAQAIDNGFNPCTPIPNQPVTFEDFNNWTPKNYDGVNGGSMTMFEGLAKSINNIVAYLMKQVGPESVMELSRRMGIQSAMEPYPSLCLGTFDISLFEMVGAYSAFVNKGLAAKPVFISRIEDKSGNIIAQFNSETSEAFSEETAYVMSQLLKGSVKIGTAGRIRYRYGLHNEIGGKTGTTQNNSDGWFMGITPEMVLGCWTGADDRAVHFRTTHLGGGANSALPLVGIFLQKAYADKRVDWKPGKFQPPASLSTDISCAPYAVLPPDSIPVE